MMDTTTIIIVLITIAGFLKFVHSSIKKAAKEELGNINARINEVFKKIEKTDNHIVVLAKNISTLIQQEIEKLKNEK